MNDLTGLLASMPGWMQTLLLVALAVLVLWARKRGGKRNPPSRPGSRPGGAQWAKPSPGQAGTDATRDLTPTEIRSLQMQYAAQNNGAPDPGEVVWTWVPFAENDGRGKDRPVLLMARIGTNAWAGCYLSTKEHRNFVSVGSGSWDSQRRESFLSPERVLRVTESGMRRESMAVDPARFKNAADAVRKWHRLP